MPHLVVRRLTSLVTIGVLVGSAACSDLQTPTAVPAAEAAQLDVASQQGGIILEPRIFPAFDVAVTAAGSMQPGKPIQINLRVRANLPVSDAEVKLSTPDMDRPQTSTFHPGFGPRPGPNADARLHRRASYGKGQVITENVQLTVPVPGYYRVVASAWARSELPLFVEDTMRVVPEIHREIWLLVEQRGGRYTARFDTLALPPAAERRAGPMHCVVELDEERGGKKRDPGCAGALVSAYDTDGSVTMMVDNQVICAESTATCDPCTFDPYNCGGEEWSPPPPTTPTDPCTSGSYLCVQFYFRDHSTGQYHNAPEGTLVEGSYQSRTCALACWWSEDRSTFVRTNAEGRIILPCPANSTSRRLRTAYEFLDEHLAVSRSEWDGPTVRGACPTDLVRVEMIANQEANVYGTMRKAARRAWQLFGYSNQRTRVDFDSWYIRPTSWYDAPLNVISINVDDIWGNEGAATQAHEYGHAYHHGSLGGIGHIYVSGDPRHNFSDDSNGSKAYLEGFAAFFETLVLPGKGDTHPYVRQPTKWAYDFGWSLPTGVRAEARVAAMFWDVIDDAHEKGTSYEKLPSWDPNSWQTVTHWGALESFDLIQHPHAWLGNILRDCRVYDLASGYYTARPRSLEAMYPCLEQGTAVEQRPALNVLYQRTVFGS